MNIIYLLLHTSWITVTLAVFAGILSGGSSARLVALINTAVTSNENTSATLAWSFAGLSLVMLLSRIASEVLLIHLSQTAILDLRLMLSRRILSSPLRYLEELGTPRLLAALTDDVQTVSSAVSAIPNFCVAIAIVFGCISYLAWLSWTVLIGVFSLMLLGAYGYQYLSKNARYSLKLAREEQDRLFKHFRTLTEGTKELKLHHQRYQAFLLEELLPTACSSRTHNVIGMATFSIANSWGQLLFFVTIGIMLFGLSHLITITPQILSGYALAIIFLMTPSTAIMNVLPILTKASIALQKLESLGLSLSTQLEGGSDVLVNPGSSLKSIELVGVTHAYRGDRDESSFILGPIDLSFHPGELVFLVGGNGSGKSTLAKLIAGLYTPASGEIRLNDQPITDKNRVWYRQHFSAVFSDFYLFERFLGLSNFDPNAQIQDYLVKLQLNHKVQIKDGILSTTNLSQGQRKRLALLTAYLENRPIYVFDEWASDQDPLFKQIFYTQLLPELKNGGKALLVISHDDRYFHLADHIVKLDYGKLEYDKHP
jgi:putative pyoverdin transport system ATP-binding/permease protein